MLPDQTERGLGPRLSADTAYVGGHERRRRLGRIVDAAVSRPPKTIASTPLVRSSPAWAMPVRASCAGTAGLDFSDGLDVSDEPGWLRNVTVGVAAVMVPSLGVRLTRVHTRDFGFAQGAGDIAADVWGGERRLSRAGGNGECELAVRSGVVAGEKEAERDGGSCRDGDLFGQLAGVVIEMVGDGHRGGLSSCDDDAGGRDCRR